jgi:hypothetical protein
MTPYSTVKEVTSIYDLVNELVWDRHTRRTDAYTGRGRYLQDEAYDYVGIVMTLALGLPGETLP